MHNNLKTIINMKKFKISTLAVLFSIVSANAQGIFDAVRFTNPSIKGTARYMSMAGSFGALGGDVSAIMDNPAALGIFRSNEFNVSLEELVTSTTGTWGRNSHNIKNTAFKLNNLSWVLNIPTNKESGYLASNFSFGYQKVKNFNRKVAIKTQDAGYSMTDYMASLTGGIAENDLLFDKNYNPFNNSDIGWLSVLAFQGFLINPIGDNPAEPTDWKSFLGDGELVTPSYTAIESGNVSDFNFAYSGNINDFVYFGISVAARTLDYTLESKYSEDFQEGGYFDMFQTLNTSGLGVNFKFGTIVRPIDWFRIGLSFQTPTYYTMNESTISELHSVIDSSAWAGANEYSLANYKFNTPYQFQISLGGVIGTTAALNLDYQFAATNKMSFNDYDDDIFKNAYDDENNDIKLWAKPTHTIKFGVEVRVAEFMKLRGGFGYITSPISQDASKFTDEFYNSARIDTEYFNDNSQVFGTCGIGFNFDNFILDLAYVYNHKNQTFTSMPSNNVAKADIKNNFHTIAATFAWRY
jgi:hypothetical protein